MKCMIPLLKDKIPIVNGIFSNMEYNFKLIENQQLDIQLISLHGMKPVAPIVLNVSDTSQLATIEEIKKLSSLVLSMYKTKWEKLIDLYTLEYDAIYNYYDELTEEITDSGTEHKVSTSTLERNNQSSNNYTSNTTNTDKSTQEKIGTSTEQNESTQNIRGTSENTGIINESIYGFNSSNSVNTDSSNNRQTSNDDETTSKNVTNSLDSNTTIKNNASQLAEKVDESSTSENVNQSENISNDSTTNSNRIRVSTHKGNIGNLTSQQLIKQEIELRKWNIIESILDDVNYFLTLPIYI